MNAVSSLPVKRRLNHVEFVHRPGERDLVLALFDLLGFEIHEYAGGEVIVAALDPTTFEEKDNDNVLAGREVRPEQWAFDQVLEKALQQEPLSSVYEGHKELLAQKPQWGMHFGIKLSSVEMWESAVARIREVEKHAPALRGRVRLLKAFRPDDPDQAFSLHQAFFWTDLIASGSLALGQRIELTTSMQ
jgi:hypothetical protein